MARIKEPREPEARAENDVQGKKADEIKNEVEKNDVPDEIRNEIENEKPIDEKKYSIKKEPFLKKLARVAIYLIIIAVLIFLILFLVSRAAQYDSIGSMLRHMWGELRLMADRVVNSN